MGLEINRLGPGDDLKQFVDFSFQHYRGNKFWIPPFRSSQTRLLSDKNPFTKKAKAKYFVVKEGGLVVGRIGASLDPELNCDRPTGFFGFFECINNQNVANLLFSEAIDYLKSIGAEEICGPIDFNTRSQVGFMEEGFEEVPVVALSYSPPWYNDLARNYGLQILKRTFGYGGNILPQPKLQNHYEKLKAQGIRLREAGSGKRLQEDFFAYCDLYNRVWELDRHFLYSPYGPEGKKASFAEVKDILDSRLLHFAEKDGEVIGALWALPDIGPLLVELQGNLGIKEIIKLIWRLKIAKQVKGLRTAVIAVDPRFRGLGLSHALNHALLTRAHGVGYTYMSRGWIWEDNGPSIKQAEASGVRRNRTYCVYKVDL